MKKKTMEELHRLTVEEFQQSEKIPLTVVLDNVRSQNNIGSVFRTADAFRIEEIVLCGICCTPPNHEIHKTALGAEDSVKWSYYKNTVYAVQELKQKNYKIYAIEQVNGSIDLHSLKAILQENQKYAVIFGHEVFGVSQEVVDMCDGYIEIPQFGTKHSLNISVTAGIVLYEMSLLLDATKRA